MNQINDNRTAKRIGYLQAFKATTAGLMIAYTFVALSDGAMWLFRCKEIVAFLIGTAVIYVTGFFIGGLTGKLIIIKKYPSIFMGVVAGYAVTLTATFFGSLIGFLKETLSDNSVHSHPFEDYLLTPLMTVAVAGFVPIVLIGIWYGWSVKRKGSK